MPSDLIQTPQTLWNQGAYQSVQPHDPINLMARASNGVGESRYSRLLIPGGAAGYQVTTGKTLYLTRLIYLSNTAGCQWLLASATADAGDNQIAAPAGIVSRTGIADGQTTPLRILDANTTYTIDLIIPIPAALFLCIRNLTASSDCFFLATGHEE